MSSFCGVPNGYLHPYSWIMPKSSGGMASYTQSSSAMSQSVANLAGGRNLEGSSTIVITLTNAQLDQIVQAIASSSMAISVSNANLAAAAGMSGTGSFSIVVNNAQLGAIISALASSNGSIASNSTLTAKAFMEAVAGGATPLSPEGLAASLLDNEDIETGYSMREALRIMLSSLAGKVSGAETTTIVFRNVNDDKNRIIATVDSNGNRTSITLDPTE